MIFKAITLNLFFYCIVNQLNAQDIILKTDGTEIQAKVTEVGIEDVKYHRFDNLTGPVYNLKKSEIFMITYQDGHKDVFGRGQKTVTQPTTTPVTQQQTKPVEPQKTTPAVQQQTNPTVQQQPSTATNTAYLGKTYKILDYYNEKGIQGIVVKVSDDGRYGTVMSIYTNPKLANWCNKKRYKKSTKAFYEHDGEKNLDAIGEFIKTSKAKWRDFPIFEWALSLGPGWYIPASDELLEALANVNGGSPDLVFENFDKLETALARQNGNTIYNRAGQKGYVVLAPVTHPLIAATNAMLLAAATNYPQLYKMHTSTERPDGKVYVFEATAETGTQTGKALNSGVGLKIKAVPEKKKFELGSTRAFCKFSPEPVFQSEPYKSYIYEKENEVYYKKHCFGLDLGIGKWKYQSDVTDSLNNEYILTNYGDGLDFGIRYLFNFGPYVGLDIFKFKFSFYLPGFGLQIMSGIRVNSPRVYKNMCFFGAGKMGYGFGGFGKSDFFNGFCYEIEFGFNYSRKCFIAFAFNQQRGKGNEGRRYNWVEERFKENTFSNVKLNYPAFRVGFNF